MRRFTSLCILLWIALNTFAQGNRVLVTIGNKEFLIDEFERIYKKNNQNLLEATDKKTPEQYLDMFINFKLKVIEAENLRMDTARSFIDELAGYRKELAAPYLTDVSYNEKLVEDTYQRMKTEVKASHILISLGENPSPDDTLKAYKKIIDIRDKILNGLNFNEAAAEYSEDPGAKSTHGDLGYFSAFQMIFPFEEVAFNTPVGGISMPVRTQFGYHLIKVWDKRPARGEIKVAHIMKMYPPEVNDSVMKKLRSEIDSIDTQLRNGADFADLAKKYSDDKRSSEVGGELAWFSSGNMISEFADQAFILKNNGDISRPFATQFGYHIIKRLDYQPVKEFAEVKKEIESKIKSDPDRSIHSKSVFIDKLKTEYNFKINLQTVDNVKNNKYQLNSPPMPQGNNLSEVLFNLGNEKFTVGKFFGFLKTNNPEVKEFTGDMFDKYFNSWIENELTTFEDLRLESKYPEFKYLLQEYYDGILLFNISDQKIWSKAAEDSTGLQKYYEKNKGAYMWGERFKGAVISCPDQATRDDVEKYYAAGMTNKEVLDRVNTSQIKIKIEEGAWEKGSNPFVDYYVWNGLKPDGFNEMLVFIRGSKTSPEPKFLNEARGLYLSDYQNYLDKEWIKDLRNKYPVEVNKKLLKTISNAAN
jgi:peptidyl-prolyl cis-trans isomerase SurA